MTMMMTTASTKSYGDPTMIHEQFWIRVNVCERASDVSNFRTLTVLRRRPPRRRHFVIFRLSKGEIRRHCGLR